MWTAARLAKMLASVVALAAPVAWACGPFFPERVLLARSSTVLTAPSPRFADELGALKVPPPGVAPNWANEDDHGRQTSDIDQAELYVALAGKPDADVIAKRYAAVRAELLERRTPPAPGKSAPRTALAVPAGLPAEFADYLEGAIAWSAHDHLAAQKAWERLLARPPADRPRRSTWAAFMLARLHHGSDAARARLRYRQTRELAAQGFADGLGLGAASLGYEALLEMDEKHLGRAAELYLAANAADDPSAVMSLRILSSRLLEADEATRAAALNDGAMRKVLVAYLAASNPGGIAPDSVEAKTIALFFEQTRGARDVEGADRLAWISYQRGDLAAADEWLRRAPEASPVTSWIRSKLLTRQGKIDEATKALARAVVGFPLDPTRPPASPDEDVFVPPQRLRGELAVLKLSRNQFVDALDLLVGAGYWRDAAHVAERVLTIDELRAHVDVRWPEAATPPPDGEPAFEPRWHLRYLLARRLARAGRWSDARPYYPPEFRPNVDAYVAAQATARDAKQKAEARADALWAMAQLERKLGLELLGTELGPDWRVDDGQYDEDNYQGKPVPESLPLISKVEQRRVKETAPTPVKRFHYRYVAAQHALEASRLLPEGSPKVGEMLCAAHRWLAPRDPKAARPYAAELRKRHASCP
jgi:hypothetical protein